jgi:hypothetical protein
MKPKSEATRLIESANVQDLSSLVVGPHEKYTTYLYKQIARSTHKIGCRENGNIDPDCHTGSDRATTQASRWLLECLTQHPDCQEAQSTISKLPSRVIDLGSFEDTGDLRLVETHGGQGRYTTLSHRWQDFAAAKTTKQNFQDRLEHLDLECLTKTMQDAVVITRNLGIRYLWIDAVCIIQGCHSDWSSTAGDMAKIYRNAVVTISASSQRHMPRVASRKDNKERNSA